MFIENIIMESSAKFRTKRKREVTEKLLLEMNKISISHGAEFNVALLSASEEAKNSYVNFLQKNNIKVIDCIFPFTEGLIVPGEGHPNGKMNALWAERIAKEIDKKISP